MTETKKDRPRIFYLLYDGYAGFELVFVANNLMNKRTATVGLGKEPCRSLENLWTVVDMDATEVDPDDVDLLVIPGGHPLDIINDPAMKEKVDVLVSLIRAVNKRGGKLAAICGGPRWLAYAGVLDGRRCTHSIDDPGEMFFKTVFTNEYVTVDGNIITGKGQAYPEFAVEMGRQMGIYETEKQAQDGLNWLRDRK
ncbi:MAG: DJ-1/PfpI family protein [Methanomassiliicoccales archaeon]|nr:DJ-1/PfpI family protein [Methanomassiliicoccales archaeon]